VKSFKEQNLRLITDGQDKQNLKQQEKIRKLNKNNSTNEALINIIKTELKDLKS